MSKEENNIIVSGMRPTGRLHLGNYHGALKNWVDLQDKYKCYFFVADLHALTTAYDRTENIANNSYEMVIDWLTAGLDSKKCTLFIQSHIPQVSELNLLLGMITPVGWLLRNPSYKEQLTEIFKKKYAGQEANIKIERAEQREGGVVQLSQKVTLAGGLSELTEQELNELAVYGFLGYPVLMATDILIHKASMVPVGQDQVAHLEIARDIVRRFKDIYHSDILVEPKPLLTKVSRVPGLDGRKMSKSYNNTIELGEDVDAVRKKVMTMFTDPNKKRANDPGNPDGCVVFSFHKIYNPDYEKRCAECKAGALGCVQCKKDLFAFMEPEVKEFNEKRKIFSSDRAEIEKLLQGEAKEAMRSAQVTLDEVRKTMRLA
ncbi:Tryptophanyl-tRNA synthetase [Elusimicrobium minutum Pei191]|uniref:Tryptophan--tRNA ligase n=1 Tax=Elusimicrobium minutum (strain Pei191) TaxID=445932 RepID=B2KE28_ELUMP|nr:tryptophan--tRNA ligase [Elusimicrobium minutum]ACC98774.1 Tryptophanyl-tRNA synthetase [Elusimicrobium minutum Pei191]